MNILAFDTSSKTASVAILRDESVLFNTLINTGQNHSEVLLPAIDQALLSAGLKMSDIDLLACTLGPGSFTGLRIGVSTMKGLMLATGKPAVGVSSLEALALRVEKSKKVICSVMDAGRGQIYTARYQYVENGRLMKLEDAQALAPSQLPASDEESLFVGDGAVKYADDILKASKGKGEIADPEFQFIDAYAVGKLAIDKFRRNEILDINTCAPVYLRSADALPKKQIFG